MKGLYWSWCLVWLNIIINNNIGKVGVNLSSWVESVPQCIRWDPGSSILHPVVLYTLGKGLALNFSTLRAEGNARTICFYTQYLLHLFSPNREFYVSSILGVRWGGRHILGDKGPLNRAFFLYVYVDWDQCKILVEGGKKSVSVYIAGVCSLADSLIAGRARCLLSVYSRIQRNWKNWHSGCVHLCCMQEEHRSVHLCVCVGGVSWVSLP